MKINLNLFKEEIHQIINEISVENLKAKTSEVKKMLGIIEFLFDQKMIIEENVTRKDEQNNIVLLKNEYYFKKNLAGGTIIGIPNSYIPESFIRELRLENGDVVQVKDKENILESLRKVTEKKNHNMELDFVLYKYCEVKNDNGIYLYCDESLYEGKKLIKLDEIPYKFVISEYLRDKFNILEGDMVDIGYEKLSPHNMKIVWKHNQETHATPLPSSHYKEKSEKIIKPLFQSIDFNENSICIIGCEPRRAIYEAAINDCNGKFLFSSGEEQLERMFSVIDKCDILLILKDFLSHTAVKKAIEHAKSIDKPFTVVDGLGIQTIIFDARKLLAQLESANV